MEFTQIFKELNKRKIQYLVAGGVAVNLHGYVRATADLDIIDRVLSIVLTVFGRDCG